MQFCFVLGLAMDILFTVFNIYFGNQYDDVPTGEAWRGCCVKHSGNHPTLNRHAMPQICSFPSLHFLCVAGFAVVSLLLLLFVWDSDSLCSSSWPKTNNDPLALHFLSSENQGMCHHAWLNCVICLFASQGLSVSGTQAGFLPHCAGCQLCSFVLTHLASRTVHPKCPVCYQ